MKPGAIIAAVLVMVLLIGTWWAYRPVASVVPVEVPPQSSTWSTYATSTFSIEYPNDYTLNSSYVHDIAPERVSHGVAFMVPTSLTEGTNLSGDSAVSVETIPELSSCHAAQYIMENPVSGGPNITDDGVEYSFATSSGAGAGNFYEEEVYVRQDAGPCIAIRYLIHSTNIGNYPEGTVQEFNRDALLAEFDQIRRSLVRQ